MKKLFSIIGKPIAHSLSPILHDYWFKKYNINANYSLLNVEEKDLEKVIERIRNKDRKFFVFDVITLLVI